MIYRRIFMVILGLAIGYLAVRLGDAMHLRFLKEIDAPRRGYGVLLAIIVAGLVSGVAAIMLFIFNVPFINERDRKKDGNAAITATLAFISACVFFGVIAAPITAYGAYPWRWATGWEILPIFASIPLWLVARDVIADIAKVRRRTRTRRAWEKNTTSIRRD